MYKNKKIIVIIMARGGSKRLPGKNIKLLNGKPLIAYAISAAINSRYRDRVIVSTDDKKIARVAQRWGAEIPFIRPAHLATDKATSSSVLLHAINFLEAKENYRPDLIVLIQPTCPFVLPVDVDKVIETLVAEGTNSCFSVCSISERPEWMFDLYKGKPRLFLTGVNLKNNSLGLPRLFKLNGAVYVVKRSILLRNKKIMDEKKSSMIIMPRERSIDIEEPFDFHLAETILNHDA